LSNTVTLNIFQKPVKCKWVPAGWWLQSTIEGRLGLAKWEVMWRHDYATYRPKDEIVATIQE